MRPVSYQWGGLAAAAATGICLSQSLVAAGLLTINGSLASGGVATLDFQRRVIVTSAGNDSGLTWTVSGTNQSGAPITDTFAGGNIAAAQSNLDFLTVTSIRGSAATASTVTAGTSATASAPWLMPNFNLTPFSLIVVSSVGGTVTYQVETTLSDYYTAPGQATNPYPPAGVPVVQVAQASGSVSASAALSAPVRGWRITITAGSGTVAVLADQAGITNY